jgi:diguanylate cyclase (GGDEF)-like protein/putative nucleotidyltransferase with HDIG domain
MTKKTRAPASKGPKRPKSAAAGQKAAPRRKAAPTSRPATPSADQRSTIRRLTAELARAEARIEQLQASADTDFLLDIPNRRGFERELQRSIAYIKRYRASGALIVLDVDRLKPINDAFGHAAGDHVLKAIVATLLGQVRSSDVIGRLGGDEFAVVMPGTVKLDGRELIERVRTEIAAELCLVSVGVAAHPEDGHDADALLAAADGEMYARKPSYSTLRAPAEIELSWAAGFARAVDERMSSDHEHGAAVASRAAEIAAELGWDEASIGELRLAAMLHDVGKVTVPDRILRKRGELDPEEYVAMVDHPVAGWKMLRQIGGLDRVAEWVLRSHEHVDGSGYPDGLSGEQIPMASRILLVADAFDAMTTKRPYRGPISADDALAELRRCAGQQFDASCVEALAVVMGATRA